MRNLDKMFIDSDGGDKIRFAFKWGHLCHSPKTEQNTYEHRFDATERESSYDRIICSNTHKLVKCWAADAFVNMTNDLVLVAGRASRKLNALRLCACWRSLSEIYNFLQSNWESRNLTNSSKLFFSIHPFQICFRHSVKCWTSREFPLDSIRLL